MSVGSCHLASSVSVVSLWLKLDWRMIENHGRIWGCTCKLNTNGRSYWSVTAILSRFLDGQDGATSSVLSIQGVADWGVASVILLFCTVQKSRIQVNLCPSWHGALNSVGTLVILWVNGRQFRSNLSFNTQNSLVNIKSVGLSRHRWWLEEKWAFSACSTGWSFWVYSSVGLVAWLLNDVVVWDCLVLLVWAFGIAEWLFGFSGCLGRHSTLCSWVTLTAWL